MKTPLVLTALLLAAAAAPAQTVWRCGADGRSYSDSPCPEGRVLGLAEARPADDIAAARDVAQREQAMAGRLAAERRLRERVPEGGGLMGIRHELPGDKVKPKPAKGSAKKRPQRPAAPDTWRATVPASPRTTG